MSKDNFVGTLKYGKCSGREHIHGTGIAPFICISENPAQELHECPDTALSIFKTKPCNCCAECENICHLARLSRNKESLGDMYEKWKKYLPLSK